MKDGKIRTGRHYCDPDVSHLNLDKQQTMKAYKKSRGNNIILK